MNNNKQSSMDKEFVPYEEALALKELGFDEPCFGRWIEPTELFISTPADDEYCQKQHKFSWTALAPLYQQAFRWFRDKHKLGAIISQFGWGIENELGQIVHNISDSENPLCYEEAELECLKKLIEIFKNK